jgi:hypothetical protein
MGFIIAASVVFIGLVLVLVKLTRHFASPQHLPVTAEWIEELSIERYRPIMRLLNQEDFHFLRAQPGFTPQMATNFRIQRCQLFQEYLRHLDDTGGRTRDIHWQAAPGKCGDGVGLADQRTCDGHG